MPICAKLANHPSYYRSASTSVPSSSTYDNPQCTSTSNIFLEASRSEVRPFIPTDSEENKGDDSEKGGNEEVQSNNESNRDRESEEDKDGPERFIDLYVEMLNDIAVWPTTLTDLMIDYIIRKKPNKIELDLSYGNVQRIVTDELRYSKVCARWVPRALSTEHKATRMMCSLTFLQRYHSVGQHFIDRIVTGDET
ncbi:histone-lysine N-methyltransferase SETMAR [Nephila pilipes]|uniref:Histone-lysine N-methyltransferase SETMAR n=1 Tax=Nephila pilipes TaxID=299642 RepID=A0A8X6U094_NEPPI|nr:histone-lysine N-methyltransferase SETMAR [Nephila pilipes]